jgi:2-oxoglutarate ferredoxin oxidoreductase subunit delta
MSDILKKYSQGKDLVIIIDRDLCKGCDICVKVCKTGALELTDASDKWEGAVVDIKEVELCNYCRLCEIQCPDFAIRVLRKNEEEEISSPVETKKTAAE